MRAEFLIVVVYIIGTISATAKIGTATLASSDIIELDSNFHLHFDHNYGQDGQGREEIQEG